MHKKLSQNVTYWLGVVAIGLVVGLSLQFVRAWTEPSVAPPGGNVGAPINTGGITQTRSGQLTVNNNLIANNLGSTTLSVTSSANLATVGGNVGIGTTSPGARLDVPASSGITARFGNIYIDATNPNHIKSTGNIALNSPGGGLALMTGNSVRLWADSSGNIGIGTDTASPTQKLDVAGYVKGQSGLCIGNDCRSSWPGGGGIGGSGSANYLAKWTAGTTLGNSTIFDNGNVGIGTTNPSQKLDVNGNINVGGSQVRMSNSSSHFYGDSSNLASRSASGDFYVQNSTGNSGRLITSQICIGSDCRSSWPGGGGGRNCQWVRSGFICNGDEANILSAVCPGNQVLKGVGVIPGGGACGRLTNQIAAYCCDI